MANRIHGVCPVCDKPLSGQRIVHRVLYDLCDDDGNVVERGKTPDETTYHRACAPFALLEWPGAGVVWVSLLTGTSDPIGG